MDVAEFIAKYWYKDDTVQEIERVRNLLAYPGIFFDGSPSDGLVLVYLCVSDAGLKMLQDVKTKEDFQNGFTERLLNLPGNNVYVFRIVTDGKPKLLALRHLRTLIMRKCKAKSFSWHDDHHVKLYTYRIKNV